MGLKKITISKSESRVKGVVPAAGITITSLHQRKGPPIGACPFVKQMDVCHDDGVWEG